MEAHKSLRTSERLAPLAIISSVRFSAANRDSACDGFAIFGPCLHSSPASRAAPAASQSCISWFGLRRGSGELITFSVLGPVYDPLVITIRFKNGTRHWCGFSGEASMNRDWLRPALRISTTTRPTSSCLYHYCLPAGHLPTSRLS